MEQEVIPPYTTHTGESIPRPMGSTPYHVPVWHRFIDAPTGEIAEHISHWIVDPGPVGYLNQTRPINSLGESLGAERARCFGCNFPVAPREGTFYRRAGPVLYMRCDDDPDYQEPNRDAEA